MIRVLDYKFAVSNFWDMQSFLLKYSHHIAFLDTPHTLQLALSETQENFENRVKVSFSRLPPYFFDQTQNPLFFNLSWRNEFLGCESGQGVKKLHFFSIFRIFKFWSILTTFDPLLDMERLRRNSEKSAQKK